MGLSITILLWTVCNQRMATQNTLRCTLVEDQYLHHNRMGIGNLKVTVLSIRTAGYIWQKSVLTYVISAIIIRGFGEFQEFVLWIMYT